MRPFNICLLSDIHLKEEYLNDGHPAKEVFEAFEKKIQDLSRINDIDCVVIVGDLAFKGDLDEYTALSKALDKAIPKHIPIVSVVGNHDVKWSELTYALNPEDGLKGIFNLKNKVFFEQERFKDVFVNFRNQIIDKFLGSRCLNQQNVEYEYDNRAYVGYLYFKSNDVLILMLNSSWKSFGPGVIAEFYDDFKDKLSDEDLKSFAIGDSLSQRGKQSYFMNRDQFPFWDNINCILQDKPGVRILTVAHHPPSWLDWEEQFLATKAAEIRLDSLLKKSHILITGHEHVPMISEPIELPNGCHNIQMGSFLDYHFIENGRDHSLSSKFPSNWFGMLKVDSYKFEIESYKLNIVNGDGGIDDDPQFVWENTGGPWSKRFNKKPTIGQSRFTSGNMGNAQSMGCTMILPEDSRHLQAILHEQRKNSLELKNTVGMEENRLYEFQINAGQYIVVLNTLDQMYDKIKVAKTFESLIGGEPIFGKLHDLLCSKDRMVSDFAFYDFIDPGTTTDYDRYYNSQYLKFQSFKHDFFGKFKNFYIFKELNINYDCFIIKS